MGIPDGQDEGKPNQPDPRLSTIDERLDRMEAAEAARTGRDRQGQDPNSRLANRVLADLIGGIAGGALFGWLADRWLGTSPWGFVILLTLGIAVAFRNIFRIANAVSAQNSANRDGQ